MKNQPTQNKPTSYEIVIGSKVPVTEDRRSHSRVISFPFEFPDGEKGAIIVLRLKDEEWKPSESIRSVNIVFQ